MVKAKTHADMLEREARRNARKDDSGDDITPPSFPSKPAASRHGEVVSPSRGSQKRAKGDAYGPVLTQSLPKRKKTETSSDASSGKPISAGTSSTMSATSTTTTSTAALQSPPSYRLAPQLQIKQANEGAASPGPGMNSDTSAPVSAAAQTSPRKMRTLAPQARPRPPSQLFAAPPDFTGGIPAATTGRAPTAGTPAPKPGAAPGNLAD
jgi:hypothetical protein